MNKRLIILFAVVLGVALLPSYSIACSAKSGAGNVHHSPKKQRTVTIEKNNCCNEKMDKDGSHDCEKKCKGHACYCENYAPYIKHFVDKLLNDFSASNEAPFTTYAFYFQKGVYITVWHPPKLV